MSLTINFTELTPYLQSALGYVATAAVGGIIGNRTDEWFMSLFYHQRKRLVDWLSNWNPQLEDIEKLSEDAELQMLFSSIILQISNELNNDKFLLWSEITDSIIRKENIPLDKKNYFVTLFNKTDSFCLEYLAVLSLNGALNWEEIFNSSGLQPDLGSNKHSFYLGQLQCATTGLTVMLTENGKTTLSLTNLGKEFIEFISNSSTDNLKKLISKK